MGCIYSWATTNVARVQGVGLNLSVRRGAGLRLGRTKLVGAWHGLSQRDDLRDRDEAGGQQGPQGIGFRRPAESGSLSRILVDQPVHARPADHFSVGRRGITVGPRGGGSCRLR